MGSENDKHSIPPGSQPRQSSVLRPDVLIVGGGVAGCPLAVTLARQGLDVILVERAAGPRRVFKGEYLQPAAVSYLNDIGFGETFQSHCSSRITHLRFRDIADNEEILSSITMNYPEGRPARSIEYFEMVTSFTKLAKQALGENFWQGTQITALNLDESDFLRRPSFELTSATRGSQRIEPRWAVGCDGRQSTVRRWMGGGAPEKNGRVVLGINDEFIFGTQVAQPSALPERYEVIRTGHRGTVSLFNLGDAGQRIYLSSREPAKEQFGQMNERFLKILRGIRSATGLTELPEQLSVSGYPANTSWFGPSTKGAFVLVGDALAVTTPYGGQGMTTAMEHVRFLTDRFDWKTESKSVQALAKSAYHHLAVNVF